jgi:hypothetical protein
MKKKMQFWNRSSVHALVEHEYYISNYLQVYQKNSL